MTQKDDNRQLSLNVAHNILNGYYVSTAMWATGIEATGMRHPTYETFVWAWDEEKKERGKMIKQYYFNTRTQALAFHFRFCRALAYRQLYKNMPSDRPFIDNN